MKRIAYFLSVVAIALVYAGCNHDDDLFDGPALNDLYGEYSRLADLDVSDREVDFAAGDLPYFTAAFSKNVDWELTITGNTSGAQKIFTGKSSRLDQTNTRWNGSTTVFPMFVAEECSVTLIVVNEGDTMTDALTITTSKVDQGFVVADFETGMNPAWGGFVQSGANMSFNITNAGPRAQGNFYYDMGGEVNWDWLIGMIEFPAQAYGGLQFPLTDNPNNLWFNVLMYKPPGINNGLVLFQFREDENADGTSNDAVEDMYAMELTLEDDGWQLVSVKYSDLVALVNGQPGEPNGNGVHEPHKLGKISVLMLANPESGYSQALMDYCISTEGGPLTP